MKLGYVLEGWYVYMIFHDVIFLQNVPTPKICTHVSYVSKRVTCQSRASEASEALVAEGADLCGWCIMISVMPGPIYIRFSGIVVGRWVIVLGQKKIWNFEIENFFLLQFFFLSSCTRTLSDLCMRDDSLGFEDCRFATHLLNYVFNHPWTRYDLLIESSIELQLGCSRL